MANTSLVIAGTGANNADAGNTAWTNPGNVTADDGTRATSNLKGSGQTTQYLHATGFGFAIPAGATIDGIVARVQRSNSAPSAVVGQSIDHTIQLIVGGSRSGDNKAAPGNWPLASADANADYGGSSDLWGLTPSPSDVNSSNFGLAVRAQSATNLPTPQVDAIWLQVYYTEPPPSTAIKMHSYRQRRI